MVVAANMSRVDEIESKVFGQDHDTTNWFSNNNNILSDRNPQWNPIPIFMINKSPKVKFATQKTRKPGTIQLTSPPNTHILTGLSARILYRPDGNPNRGSRCSSLPTRILTTKNIQQQTAQVFAARVHQITSTQNQLTYYNIKACPMYAAVAESVHFPREMSKKTMALYDTASNQISALK